MAFVEGLRHYGATSPLCYAVAATIYSYELESTSGWLYEGVTDRSGTEELL